MPDIFKIIFKIDDIVNDLVNNPVIKKDLEVLSTYKDKPYFNDLLHVYSSLVALSLFSKEDKDDN